MFEVYSIKNSINNKLYIGITIQGVKVRYGKHLSDSRGDSRFPIHNAIRLHGEDNFTVEVIEECRDIEHLKERETYWIDYYKSNDRSVGYNLTSGGDGTFGRLHSDETKDKIRKKAIGRKYDDATKLKMSLAKKGKPTTKKSQEKLMELNNMSKKRTKQFNVETKEEYITDSTAEMARYINKSRPTLQYRIDTGRVYDGFIYSLI